MFRFRTAARLRKAAAVFPEWPSVLPSSDPVASLPRQMDKPHRNIPQSAVHSGFAVAVPPPAGRTVVLPAMPGTNCAGTPADTGFLPVDTRPHRRHGSGTYPAPGNTVVPVRFSASVHESNGKTPLPVVPGPQIQALSHCRASPTGGSV